MFVLLFVVMLFVGLVLFETHFLITKKYALKSKVPLGLKYIHISDLHGKTWFINGSISQIINDEAPDFVVVTGDLTDREAQLSRVVTALGRIVCPVFMVLGNHDRVEEGWFQGKKERHLDLLWEKTAKYESLKLLVNEAITFRAKGKTVSIYGFDNSKYGFEQYNNVDAMLGEYKILLAHSPSIAKKIVDMPIEFHHLLVGHTHGNQINLPILKGTQFYIPHVGLTEIGEFKYVSVSKGLGTTRIPVRINCRPEMVIYKI
jgi:hypothetical protein